MIALQQEEEEEEEGEEFEHLNDEDEFEGFDRERPTKSKSHDSPPDLKIAKVVGMDINTKTFCACGFILQSSMAFLRRADFPGGPQTPYVLFRITVNSRIYPAGYARFYLPRTPPAGYMRVRVILNYFYTGTSYIQK